tara:strand:+ start:11852 stop:13753 length:1902 start_codon:yes stop_codon:yes gene_type:complete
MSCGCGCSGEAVAYENWDDENVSAAEYQGRKVTLNKPFRTKGESKKFGVYTKNGSGKVVIVRFGDPNMEIKRDSPERRKSFRSRHNCQSPGPKWKARYWSCRQWRSSSPVEAEDGSPCGCGCNDESAEAKDADDPCTEGYEQYGMKNKNGRKVPNCIPIKKDKAKAEYKVCSSCTTQAKCAEMGDCMKAKMDKPSMEKALKEAALPKPKNGESHDEFMSRCEAMGNSREECMAAHEGHEFEVEGYKDKKDEYASETCGVGEELIDGECRKVAVTLDLNIDNATSIVEATTGNTIIEIKGIAFHQGMNKNKWEITAEGARFVAEQMIGSDLTLNHPDAEEGKSGFGRNMDGGVDKANVGYIHSASFHPKTDGGYEVRYVAHVTRPELFEALESGLWLRPDYGVSIGGSGVPIKADEDGIVFGEDFTFDHLAIVHRPAYAEANIESVTRIQKEEEIKATLISHSNPAENNTKQKVKFMSEEENTNTPDYEAQIEELRASLVLANSQVDEFKALEDARIESSRMELVSRASEMGMSGHDDLKAETLETLIASWEASHPVTETVEMKPIDETPAVASTEVEAPKAVVANYLNGSMVESDEGIYSRCYNAWAKAWNGTLAGNESEMRAKSYEQIKEMM